jgi:hypothetical protein
MTTEEKPKVRTLADVQQEWNNTCAELGQVRFSMRVLPAKEQEILTRLDTLEAEAAALKNNQDQAAK